MKTLYFIEVKNNGTFDAIGHRSHDYFDGSVNPRG
jgi:hypothetical protein